MQSTAYMLGVHHALEKLGYIVQLGENLGAMKQMLTKTDPRTGEKSFGWNPPKKVSMTGWTPWGGTQGKMQW